MTLTMALLLVLVGCLEAPEGDNPPAEMGKVTGTVTVGGQKYAGITVIFDPKKGGGGSMAETDKEGHYELEYGGGGLKGAVIGEHQVAFRHNEEEIVDGQPIPGGESVLPEKYFEGMSTITREVKAGEQVINFELHGK
jgi:hypothetical protein